MSSRPQFSPHYVITDGSMGTSLTSQVTVIQKLSLISYACNWAGTTPVGAISVEVSNDYEQNADGTVKSAGTWSELPLSSPTAVSGNTGDGFIDVFATSAYAIRLVYTRASGTGTLNVVVSGKVA